MTIRGYVYTGAVFSVIALERLKIGRRGGERTESTVAQGRLCVRVSFDPVRSVVSGPRTRSKDYTTPFLCSLRGF